MFENEIALLEALAGSNYCLWDHAWVEVPAKEAFDEQGVAGPVICDCAVRNTPAKDGTYVEVHMAPMHMDDKEGGGRLVVALGVCPRCQYVYWSQLRIPE